MQRQCNNSVNEWRKNVIITQSRPIVSVHVTLLVRARDAVLPNNFQPDIIMTAQ